VKEFLRRLARSSATRRLRTWLAEADLNGEPEYARFCFVHIPKTGGTYVTQSENSNRAVIFPIRNLGHSTLVDPDWEMLRDVPPPFGEAQAIPRACVDGRVVFSNVRNIFSLFVSYLHHAAGRIEKYRNPHHYDFAAANRGFDYLLKTIADRDLIWPSRKFVHYQLFAQPSGAPMVGWLNCTASLDQHLHEMAHAFGLGYRHGEPQRVGPPGDYRRYYTDGLADLVYRTWKREIDLFGFEFDEPSARYTARDMTERVRSMKYVLRSDELSPQQSSPEAQVALTRRPRIA
jgi:hypothetical protein